MWTHDRKWKHAFLWSAVILAWVLLRDRELSPGWYAGLVIALLLALAYLAEEIVWMIKRRGRPCGHCGQTVQMKSFRLQASCPHCGRQLD